MELHNLRPAKGSTGKAKRIGRGQGSGRGGTSTRGHKGAQSRSGYSKKIGHEGGQQPLQRRVPKFGFKNPFRVSYQAVNLGKLEAIATEKKVKSFDPKVFAELGLAGKNDLVKVLADGELKSKIDVTAHAFSKKAVEMIEKAGGKVVSLKAEIKEESEAPKAAAPKAKATKAAPKKEEAPVEAKANNADKPSAEKKETVEAPKADDSADSSAKATESKEDSAAKEEAKADKKEAKAKDEKDAASDKSSENKEEETE